MHIPSPLKSEYSKIARFVISGGTGAMTHFLILIFCREIVGMSVVLATTIAFVIASVVSFSMQKLWAFQNKDMETIPRQVLRYLCVALTNVFINGVLMFLLAKEWGIYYILAQIITSSFVAIESYFLYKHFVFKKNI